LAASVGHSDGWLLTDRSSRSVLSSRTGCPTNAARKGIKMNKVSSMYTGGAALSVDAIEPTVSWALHGFNVNQIPDSTALLIASVILVAAHAGYNWINDRMSRPSEPTLVK
jgi:hypothetical protein